MIGRREFYLGYRKYFENKIVQGQVNGFEALMDFWESYYPMAYFELFDGPLDHDPAIPQFAYILATAYHETRGTMLPVREGFATSNEQAVRIVTRMHQQGRIRTNYALPDPVTKLSYYGRGITQVTWKDNYLKLGMAVGKGELYVREPDQLLDLYNSVEAHVVGMYQGLFCYDKKSGAGVPFRYDLWDFFSPKSKDYINARRIINGTDCANLVAGHAERFEKCLREAV